MTDNPSPQRHRAFLLGGLGIALLVAIFLSPFASQDPDGLERVAKDLQFEQKALEDGPARKLPFYALFEEYALRGVPPNLGIPLAGAIGTLAAFGLAWGIGKLVIRPSAPSQPPEDGDS